MRHGPLSLAPSGRVMCRPGPRLAPESAPPSASLFACHAAVRRRRLEVPLGRIPDLHTGWHDCDTWRVNRAGRVQSVECSRRRTLTQGSIGFSRSSTMRPRAQACSSFGGGVDLLGPSSRRRHLVVRKPIGPQDLRTSRAARRVRRTADASCAQKLFAGRRRRSPTRAAQGMRGARWPKPARRL